MECKKEEEGIKNIVCETFGGDSGKRRGRSKKTWSESVIYDIKDAWAEEKICAKQRYVESFN